MEKGPGTDIRNREGPSHVSRDGGRSRNWKHKTRLAFTEKVRIQKLEENHKENVLILSM